MCTHSHSREQKRRGITFTTVLVKVLLHSATSAQKLHTFKDMFIGNKFRDFYILQYTYMYKIVVLSCIYFRANNHTSCIVRYIPKHIPKVNHRLYTSTFPTVQFLLIQLQYDILKMMASRHKCPTNT